MIRFAKYQGTGNDFILIDNRGGQVNARDKIGVVRKWCDRRFGIGSDGLIFLELSDKADFFMDFYNPDGSQSFCGNGSRCAVRYALDKQVVSGSEIQFEAIDGSHQAVVSGAEISIKMGDVERIEYPDGNYFIHTGSPHYIKYDQDILLDIVEFGKKVRYSETYRDKGTNVNLVKEVGENHIDVRTYERGVENETLSCGTGVTACVLSFAERHKLMAGDVKVDVRGGALHVSFSRSGTGYADIWLSGPAEYVYEGVIP